jgi:hypothetical protein
LFFVSKYNELTYRAEPFYPPENYVPLTKKYAVKPKHSNDKCVTY